MTTVEFLSHLRGLGVKLWTEDGRLRFRAAQNVMTPELKAELAERKGEILEFFRQASAEAQTPPPIMPVARDGQLRLSFAQERLWFIDQWQPGSATYNLLQGVRLHGRLDIAVVERSLSEIVRRHEALRTTFTQGAAEGADGQPIQIIHPPAALPLPLIDLGSLPADEREAEAQRLINAEAQRPFDLQQGPLVRATLLRLHPEGSRDDYVLLFNMHHIVSDGWSIGVLINEFTALYSAGVRQQQAQLPALPVQYADYAAWQRQYLQGAVLERQLDYWRRQLAGAPALLELPTDRPRPPVQSFRGAHERHLIPAALAEQLGALSQQQGVTLFQTLLAAFQTLLYRLSGQPDIVVGSPIAGRSQPEVQSLIGFFVNILVLRTRCTGNPSFVELLQRVNETTLGAYAHQELPFEKLVEALQPERNTGHAPLYQVVFLLDYAPTSSFELPDLSLSLIEMETGSAKMDLSVGVVESTDGLWVSAEYATDLFDAATIQRLLRQYVTLIQSIVADPRQRVDRLALLTDAEQQQIVHGWNATAAPFPETTIHALVEAQVARTPDAIAVVCGEQRLRYAELDRRANQLAHELQRRGVGPEARVCVCMERSIELVVALLAVLKAGGGYVPLDPELPQERLHFMVEDSQAQAVITKAAFVERLPHLDAPLICVDRDYERIAALPEFTPASGALPDNLAYMIYTSGSTGTPKGVMVQHRSACNNLWWRQKNWPLTGEDRLLHAYSFSFDPSVWACFWPLIAGAQVLVIRSGEQYDAAAQVRLMQEHEATIYGGSPAIYSLLVEEPELARCTRMRSMVCGGDRVTGELQRRLFALLNTELVNAYGPTEATIDTTIWRCEHVDDPQPAPIGRPIDNTRVYLLDAQLQPVPVGVTGEIFIGGLSLARGYHHRPALTAEKFLPDPFNATPGSRMYRSGDLGRYRADGVIEFQERSDFQVKIRGFRVELGEIEAALLRHPELREAAVIVREDAEPGAAIVDKRLVAYIVENKELRTTEHKEPGTTEHNEPGTTEHKEPRSSEDDPKQDARRAAGTKHQEESRAAELRAFLQQSLPEHMIPAAFVVLERLPLTSNGKLDRAALPRPSSERSAQDAGFVAPRTPTEELVASIWAEIFGVSRVSVHDDFFALGGHSLLATRVISRIRGLLQVELPIRALFEGPTVAQLAARIESLRRSHPAPQIVVAAERPERLPLSFAQQRLWFLEQLQPNTATYNIPTALRLSGDLDVAALEAGLNRILERHEVLRTTFALLEGEPVQIIHPYRHVKLPVIDLQSLEPAAREQAARQMVAHEIQQPFDLEAGPLLRVTLARLHPEGTRCDHLLILVMHHIISDGWSMGVFVRELTTLYSALARGDSIAAMLPALPMQYADYALWQRNWLQGAVLEQQLDYWRRHLVAVPVLNLPTDYPRPVEPSTRGASQAIVLAPALHATLLELSRREGATLFMTLLAAFQVLLHRYSGQTDFAIGTPLANRTRGETESLLGCFVNTLTLRADLSGNPSFRELLRRVREVSLEAYAHQDVPFEQVVDALQPERDLSHHPLFQVLFTLQNTSSSDVALPGLTLHPVELEIESAKFDLSLFLAESDEGLTGGIEYSTDLFEAATIARMAGHLEMLLSVIAAEPDARIAHLSLLTAAEQQQVLHDWNQSVADYPRAAAVHELIEAQAARSPERTAIVFAGASLTYAELNRRANQLAHYLVAQGVGPDVLVALCVERSLEMLVGMLAILKAGAAYVPLDPAYPADRLRYMLSHSQAPVILTQAALVAKLPEHRAQVFRLDADWPSLAQQPTHNPPRTALPQHVAYLIYTSGSTGRPKGVMVTQQGLLNLVHGLRAYFDDPAVTTTGLITSISFDISVNQIFPTLIFGRTLHIIPDAVKFNSRALLRYLDDHQIHLLDAVPSYLQVVLNDVAPEQPPNVLRYLLIGGEKLEQRLLQAVFGQLGAPVTIVNIYGLTEISDINILGRIVAADLGTPITVGKPLQNNRIYIVDAWDQPQPVGIAGEVCVAGESVSRGYLHRPELTAERFVVCPFEDGQIMVRTGDLGRWRADGTVEILGRIDHQVKVRGFRIETSEIEAVLAQHPGVMECVVVVREESVGAYSDKRLVAYLAPRDGMAAPSAEELRQLLGSQLPNYMVPSAFVVLDGLPRTPNGKIDRKALPAPQQETGQAVIDLPRDLIELQLARIWQELLGVERIGVRDNFFELGGHSLLAVRLMSQIRQHFDQQLPLSTLFHGATIEHLASAIRQQSTSASSLVVPIQPNGSKRPLFCVHPVGGNVFSYLELAQALGADQPLYGIQAAALIEGQGHDTRIEEMAARYIDALRAIQPQGPYQLGGWSLGGVIAFEMARQLQAQGEETALLALIDSWLGADVEPLREDDELQLLSGFAYDLGLPITLLPENDPLLQAAPEELFRLLYEQARADGIVPPDMALPQVMQLFELYKTNRLALQRYIPARYHGYVTLFQASERPHDEIEAQVISWQRVAAGGVSVYRLPGDHYTLLRQPQLEQLAERLRLCIEEAQMIDQA
jgi:amino acid adenylation domain-containing protein